MIGIASWTCASKPEVAQLDRLRDDHRGPIVALIERLPSARGARAVSALLEGRRSATDSSSPCCRRCGRLRPARCVVPRSIRELLQRPPLSPRERQVLAMVVLDFSNAEIAEKLVVIESNVKSHPTSAFSQLGVNSRNAAAELILDHESGLGSGILRISPEE